MQKLDVVICLGKSPNRDGSLDTILKNRVELAYSTAINNHIPLILSGGKSHTSLHEQSITEASAMLDFIETNFDAENVSIVLEEKGESTIQQLCLIKNQIVIPNNWKNIGLVTDNVHLKRAVNTAKWIFGDKYNIVNFGSKLGLSEEKINQYKNSEKEKLSLSVKNFSNNFQKGDDKAILEYDKLYRKAMKKHIKKGGNPKDVLKIPFYH